MKISIVTVVLNQHDYIGEAIDSVISQDYTDIEYIVVDGKSTDGTLDIIKSYGNKITKVVSEKDKGLYDALNKGIALATGDYIGFVHSDDMLYDKSVISRIVHKLEEDDCDLLYGNGIFVSTSNRNCVIREWISGVYSKHKVRFGWLPLHTTVYIRRSVYMRYGGYDISYRIAGDTDLLVRYLYDLDLKISYLNDMIIIMRIGGKSTSVNNSVKKWKEDLRLYRAHNFSFMVLPCKVMRKIPQYLRQKDFYKTYLLSKIVKK